MKYDSLVAKDTSPLNSLFLKELLYLATKESYFIFNNILYKQIDGVAMGSPLGPSLANAFLGHHEQKLPFGI